MSDNRSSLRTITLFLAVGAVFAAFLVLAIIDPTLLLVARCGVFVVLVTSCLVLYSINVQAVNLWWIGFSLFAPSVLFWTAITGTFIYNGVFNCPVDWYGLKYTYFPMLAAIIGLTLPTICLLFLRASTWRSHGWFFAGYLAVMTTWSAIDISYLHCQEFRCRLTLASNNVSYLNTHVYYTWWFVP